MVSTPYRTMFRICIVLRRASAVASSAMKGPSAGCLVLLLHACSPHRPDEGQGSSGPDASCAQCTADKRGVIGCDHNTGLAPGQVAILFLGGSLGTPPQGCPAPPAAPIPQITGTGLSDSFHITTDVPTVAYQINPYGGGSVAVTGASLLIPTSAWDVNYVAVNVSQQENGPPSLDPSLNIIARDDATTVTIVPTAAITGGTGVPAGGAGQPVAIHLNKGQNVQITQGPELTGSVFIAAQP